MPLPKARLALRHGPERLALPASASAPFHLGFSWLGFVRALFLLHGKMNRRLRCSLAVHQPSAMNRCPCRRDDDRLTRRRKLAANVGMVASKRSCGAFSMNAARARASVNNVRLHFGDVVCNIVQRPCFSVNTHLQPENGSQAFSQDGSVGKSEVSSGVHRIEVGLPFR